VVITPYIGRRDTQVDKSILRSVFAVALCVILIAAGADQ